MKILRVAVATAKQRVCPKCKEKAYYDRRRDFRNADESDEEWTYNECRLCGHKDEHKPRNTAKQQQKRQKAYHFSRLIDELIKKK